MPPDDSRRQAQLGTHGPHLVLEERAQRLDELELQVFGQAADVVVTLDVGRTLTATGLDDVGIERALHQELDLAGLTDHLASSRLEGPNELSADDLALLLRIGHASERGEELL